MYFNNIHFIDMSTEAKRNKVAFHGQITNGTFKIFLLFCMRMCVGEHTQCLVQVQATTELCLQPPNLGT
jgi:hypothetical protein